MLVKIAQGINVISFTLNFLVTPDANAGKIIWHEEIYIFRKK
jgi:hypothetical protein